MKQKNLWLICGVPASGKSTFIEQELKKGGISISRDKVRFSIIKEDEEYFSHENEVFKEFIKQINEALEQYKDVYVDATHINEKSRNKVLNNLHLNDININAINIITPLDLCLERNSHRIGRARVPESALKDMYKNFRPATFNEKYTYNSILTITQKEDN